MASDDDMAEFESKRLCYHCIGEQFLQNEVRRNGEVGSCAYCRQCAESYTIEGMAERVESAFEQHYIRTDDQPIFLEQIMLSDRELDYSWERSGEPVVSAITDAAEIPEQAARDIQSILDDKHGDFHAAAIGEETEFSSESYYAVRSPSDQAWQEEWRNFERSLKTEARFFSREGVRHLVSIFKGIDNLSTKDGRALVIDAGPAMSVASVFRARVFQSDAKLVQALCRPDQYLGSPSAHDAMAGRMNARGISVFYGATEADTAIAEVRPPVGSQVAVARFDIIRRLRLLDLSALRDAMEQGSLFDPGWVARLERATFLGSLSERMTRAVMPDDEAFEYLPTQAIADFLATENEPALDGIGFPSVQGAGNGHNVVLFHKAARVEAMELPAGTKIEASTGYMSDEGWERYYSVDELVLKEDPVEIVDVDDLPFDLTSLTGDGSLFQDDDGRQMTLRIDLESVRVHVVGSVHFECDAHKVQRHRREKQETEY